MAYKKKAPVKRIPYVRKFDISSRQQNFIDHYQGGNHFICEAVPGSGKTTTGSITFNEFLLPGKTHFATSFSNNIVDTLTSVMPPAVFCKGVHASGLQAITTKFGRPKVSGFKVSDIVKEQGINPFEVDDPKKKAAVWELHNQVVELVHMTKVCNIDYEDDDAILEMANERGLDLGDNPDRTLGEAQMALITSFQRTNIVDFDDMLRFPIEFDLPLTKYDVVFVDEQQDFSDVMIAMVSKMVGGQYIGVGDRYQAIMGFSGAGLNSVDNIRAHYGDCDEIPLDVCYRCATSIVENAQNINPAIQPFEGNDEGVVEYVPNAELLKMARPGDALISRRNAILLAGCFSALKDGRPAMIKGKSVGVMLSNFLKKLGGQDVDTLLDRLDNWEDKERRRIEKRNSSQAMEAMENKLACSKLFIEQAQIQGKGVSWIHDQVNNIFADKLPADCVQFMTGHGSKGLEFDRCFVMQYPRFRLSHPKMTADDHTQERNVDFVAITRAKKELYLGEMPEENEDSASEQIAV